MARHYDDGRQGRFKADDTFRKWFLRIFATIGVMSTAAAVAIVILFILGVKAVI